MGKPQHKYKRSWKNLLINKPYQLTVTGVLVVATAVPLIPLGVWVMSKANAATKVAETQVGDTPCDMGEDPTPAPLVIPDRPPEPAGSETEGAEPGENAEDSKDPEAADGPDEDGEPATAGDGPSAAQAKPEKAADPKADPKKGEAPEKAEPTETAADGEPPADATPSTGEGNEDFEAAVAAARGEDVEDETLVVETDPVVTIIDEQVHEIPATPPVDRAARLAKIERCEADKAGRIAQLRDGEQTIFMVLIGASLLLLLGMAIYSIKMTHKVAGPLFKIGTYFDRLAGDKYAPVYNLRKGDHLVEFFARFKAGYDGLTEIEKQDIAVIEAALAHAEKADLASKSDEMAAAVEDLQKVLDAKRTAMAELLDKEDA